MHEVRRSNSPIVLAFGLGAILLIGSAASPAQPDSFINTLLRQHHFSTGDFRALDAGSAVVKSLDTPVRQELAHFGVVHIDATAERFVERFADVERFERGPGIPQIGRFGTPPQLADLAALTLPPADVAALAACRPGECEVKLSAAEMTRFHERVDWTSLDATRQAHEVAREMLLDLVRTYQTRGNAALGSFDDGDEPLPVAGQFRALLDNSVTLPVSVPGLMTYLDRYPQGRPADVHDFFYWSVVDFGLKPTLRVNHVLIYPLAARPSGVSHVIGIKQLYASHYFRSALELRFLVEGSRRQEGRGFYLISITRTRIDGTTGLKGSLLRAVVNRRSRNAVRGYLEHLKRQVERPASAPGRV